MLFIIQIAQYKATWPFMWPFSCSCSSQESAVLAKEQADWSGCNPWKVMHTIGFLNRSILILQKCSCIKKNNLRKFYSKGPCRKNNSRKGYTIWEALPRMVIFFKITPLRSQIQFKYLREKLLLSQKLCYEGSRFLQCFILSTAPHYLWPSKVLW